MGENPGLEAGRGPRSSASPCSMRKASAGCSPTVRRPSPSPKPKPAKKADRRRPAKKTPAKKAPAEEGHEGHARHEGRGGLMVDASAVGTTDEPFQMTVERGQDPRVRPGHDVGEPGVPRGPGAADRADVPDVGRVLDAAGPVGVLEGEAGPASGCCTAGRSTSSTGRRRTPVRSSPCRRRVDEIYEKEGKRGGTMTFVVTVTEFRDEYGQAASPRRGRPRSRPASPRPRRKVRDGAELGTTSRSVPRPSRAPSAR